MQTALLIIPVISLDFILHYKGDMPNLQGWSLHHISGSLIVCLYTEIVILQRKNEKLFHLIAHTTVQWIHQVKVCKRSVQPCRWCPTAGKWFPHHHSYQLTNLTISISLFEFPFNKFFHYIDTWTGLTVMYHALSWISITNYKF